jgi:hypothetical protein
MNHCESNISEDITLNRYLTSQCIILIVSTYEYKGSSFVHDKISQ